jgi:thiol-disulfide isomerase/thioredoxin
MPAKYLARSLKVILITLILTSCGTPSSTISSDTEAGFVAGNGTAVYLNSSERIAAPEIKSLDFENNKFELYALRGKVVVINVWGSWCGPCRKEARELEALYQKNKIENVDFVGINIRDSKISAESFIANFGITYKNIYDRDGVLLLGFKNSLPANAIPSTLIIDKNGKVAARQLGPIDRALLQGFISALVEE